MEDNYWIIILVLVSSFLLTGVIRRYGVSRKILDIPNERSSHTSPTPHSGGLAIALSFLASLLFLSAIGRLELSTLNSLFGPGVVVALIGFIDDRRHVAARWRLLAHFVASVWALVWLGGLPPILVFGFMLDIKWLGYLLAAIYLVWLLNLYNFMDGINGIAGVEAVTVCLGGAIVYMISPIGGNAWLLPILLLMAVAGFLFWNFPTAKIFMGDVGSGFIGIMLGIISIQSAWLEEGLFWCWLILLGAFVVDATVTLFRRIMRGQKFFVAHRSHAYQYASRKYNSHSIVTIIFGVINLLWLLPIAIVVIRGKLDGALGVIIAYLPLVFLAVYFKAGASELQDV